MRTEVSATWSRMRLAELSCHAEEYAPESTDVWAALNVVQSGLLDVTPERAGLRAVPSAGAIHPYEIIIVARQENAPHSSRASAFKVDLLRRVCQYVDTRQSDFEGLPEAELPNLPVGGAHIVILTRPWLSMRKYGMRGYLYSQLDTAHVGTSLLGSALAAGYRAELRLRVSREGLRKALPSLIAHREISCVLTIRPPHFSHPTENWTLWRRLTPERDGYDLLDEMEHLCWCRIPEQLHDRTADPVTPTLQSVISYPTNARARPDIFGRWADLSRRRSSSKVFTSDDVSDSKLERVFAASMLPVPIDATPDCRVTMSVYRAASRPSITEMDRIVRACSEQRHLSNASAFAVFHSDAHEILSSTQPYLVCEALFKAGIAAHLMYLSATAEDLGITAVGGFHSGYWRELLGLEATREVLYVVALGRDRRSSIKVDRETLAHAHGE